VVVRSASRIGAVVQHSGCNSGECGRRLSVPIPESRSQSGHYTTLPDVKLETRAGQRPALSLLLGATYLTSCLLCFRF